ncbi:MAG: sulfotransferase family 2 domain-containing protein [Spirochaetes bacterium]|nr:sulfotransferase family 2 domain-containing protein [Spirochaetota bacterium]
MIISHKYKFIFIKTFKTAGTSIEVYLSQHCGEGDVFTPIIPYVAPHRARNYQGYWNPLPELLKSHFKNGKTIFKNFFLREKYYNHISAKILRSRIPSKIWKSYFKFCIERNPFDRAISHYYMLKYRNNSNLSFGEYIKQGQFCINLPLYTENKKIIVDKIIRYENLSSELGAVFSILGIPFSGNLGIKAKSEYRDKKKSYKDLINDQQRQILETIFAEELQLHGYQF